MKTHTFKKFDAKSDDLPFHQEGAKHQVTGENLLHRIRSAALAIGGTDDLAEAIEGTKRP